MACSNENIACPVQPLQHRLTWPPFACAGVDGNWRCPSCSNINFGSRDNCNRCRYPKPPEAGPGIPPGTFTPVTPDGVPAPRNGLGGAMGAGAMGGAMGAGMGGGGMAAGMGMGGGAAGMGGGNVKQMALRKRACPRGGSPPRCSAPDRASAKCTLDPSPSPEHAPPSRPPNPCHASYARVLTAKRHTCSAACGLALLPVALPRLALPRLALPRLASRCCRVRGHVHVRARPVGRRHPVPRQLA